MSPYGPFGNKSQRNTACLKIWLHNNILFFKLIIQIFNELIKDIQIKENKRKQMLTPNYHFGVALPCNVTKIFNSLNKSQQKKKTLQNINS